MNTPEVLYHTWVSLQAGRQTHGDRIDEVALLFHSSVALDAFIAKLPPTVEHFNSVPCDVMKRQDLFGSFQVRFEFLRFAESHPLFFRYGDAPWRIEAMCVLEGDAPLHRQKIATSVDLPTVVHWSYKCADLNEYQAEVHGLREISPMRAEYRNDYGMFSYFGSNGVPYLKPRVNLRDV